MATQHYKTDRIHLYHRKDKLLYIQGTKKFHNILDCFMSSQMTSFLKNCKPDELRIHFKAESLALLFLVCSTYNVK